MSIINTITETKQERIKARKAEYPIAQARSGAESAESPRDFKAAISRQGGDDIRLIAELKKASPSKGLIRKDFDPKAIAQIYDKHADAISVLTEEDFFQGDLGYIEIVKSASSKPTIRKDFIIDEYQIFEARAAGADAMLLIDSILDTGQASDYLQLIRELGMYALFEVHDMRGLEMAMKIEADIVGINNRDLRTLTIDLANTELIKAEIPSGIITVSESGILSFDDAKRVSDTGVDAMLVGTVIMQAPDIEIKMMELKGEEQSND